ncbi:hypothetical protein E2C01_069783 [Portunus trituberculatus]|uniref:Uncharacterized protein n=1 Tax=Portunus trituberculatus TaxID=210409 RepID=A0A5B7I1R9_PORTR|nr:hypothetical protein [Portunus trituberculatus]
MFFFAYNALSRTEPSSPTLRNSTIPSPSLPFPTLPCPALPYPVLSCPTLSCPALPALLCQGFPPIKLGRRVEFPGSRRHKSLGFMLCNKMWRRGKAMPGVTAGNARCSEACDAAAVTVLVARS